MIFVKKFISAVGVALCAAPIFLLLAPTVSAQQGNNQSQMLFEMQAMRQEIAELRDMVERQAYQLRQLQNTSPQTGNLGSNSQQPSSALNEYETVTNGVPTANGVPSDYYPGGVTNPTFPSASGTQEETNADQYPTSVEERPMVQTTGQTRNTNSPNGNYPPVEERTIAGGGAGQQAPAYDPETYNQQQAPAVNQQQVPVINPGDIQPYQRDMPAQQPTPNNIPNADAPSGGVVTIPEGSSTQIANQANNSSLGQPSANIGLGEQTYYQQGFELLKQSKHDEAITTFKKQISDYPNGEYADDAHYWIAESLYVNRDLDQSKLYFKAIIDRFAQSPRLPDAMLKTAYIEQEQGNVIEARILLQEIIQFHPRSNAAISAKNRLADLN